VGRGHVANAQGWIDEARVQWEGALRIFEEIGAPSAASVRDLLAQLGRI
jgi:hypothetical protein